MEDTVECPYCEESRELEIESEDFDNWGTYETECIHCDKIFWVEMYVTCSFWQSHKMPCSNWEPCEFSTTVFGLPWWRKKKCPDCWKYEE